MTQVNTADGPIATDLPAEAVADLEVKAPESTPEPAKAEEAKQPEATPAAEPKAEPAKEPAPEPKGEPALQAKPKKAGPIADLLAKKHELETALEAERKAKSDLEAKLAQFAQQPASPQANDKIKVLAEKYGLEPDVLSDIVTLARDGVKPSVELPQEVADMLAEHQQSKAIAAETAAFNRRIDSLASAIPGEPIKEHKDKLMALAYSDKTDPVTGERYADMELAEIYFRAIKPEVEPGKPSGESTPTSGTKAAKPVLDFQDIFDRDDPADIEAMDDATFKKYQTWLNEKQGDTKLTHSR